MWVLRGIDVGWQRQSFFFDRLSGALCILAGAVLSLQLLVPLSPPMQSMLGTCNHVFLAYMFLDICLRVGVFKHVRHVLAHPLDLAIFVPILAMWYMPVSAWGPLFVVQLPLLLMVLGRLTHLYRLFTFLRFQPVHALIAGFGMVIFVGSLLLSFPVSTPTPLPYIDVLFTAASAVCVTGLSSVDFANDFTRFGHVVVMCLIQIGGIGFMTFTTLMVILMNQRMSHRETSEMQEAFMAFNRRELVRMVVAVFQYTLVIEALGAVCLFLLWHHHFSSWQEALFASVFHAVSAFCNAGFSLFSDNLIGFQTSSGVLYVVSSLIVLGGIGFPVLFNLRQTLSRGVAGPRFRLQTKLAVGMTVLLIFFGSVVFFFSEQHHTLSQLSWQDQVANAVFMSVSPRTAGFNAVDMGGLHVASVFFTMVLMFIGASPGSTGGGIKTTTFGILMLAFFSTLRMQDKVEMGQRQIPLRTLMRASAIVIMSALTVIVFCFALLYTEGQASFQAVLFETVSAFATVGLSLGLTPLLSVAGKSMIIILMLIGRVGPFAAAVALAVQKPRVRYQYPEEDILVA